MKCFIYSYLDNYFPKERGVCSNPGNLHGRYDSLKLAKIACNRDSHCIGVQDTKCETSGIFKICKTGFRTPAQHSCIHEKQGFTGTCLSIVFLQLMFISNFMYFWGTDIFDFELLCYSTDWNNMP